MQSPEQENQRGVMSVRTENNHYVVEIIWKDGQPSTSHFPISGFEVINPQTHQKLGHFSGEQALEILKTEAGKYTYEEFNWQNMIGR